MSFWKHIKDKVAFDQPDMRFELLERESGEPRHLFGWEDVPAQQEEAYEPCPDTLAEVKDALDNLGLNISYPLTYETTEDVESSLVVDIYPKSGSQIEKGQKVKLTISNGKFKYMDNYVGKDYDTVFNLLSDTNFKVNVTYVSNDEYAPGTIIKQSIEAGTQYDPYISNDILFTVVDAETMNIPIHLLGENVFNTKIQLEEEGFNVEIKQVEYDSLSSSQKEKYKEYQIVNVEPQEGAQYIKKPDSKVILEYYVEGD